MAAKNEKNPAEFAEVTEARVDPNDPASWPSPRVGLALSALEGAKSWMYQQADLVSIARFLIHADPTAARDALLVYVSRAVESQGIQGLPPAAVLVDETLELAKSAPPLPANVGFVESCKPVLRSLQSK